MNGPCYGRFTWFWREMGILFPRGQVFLAPTKIQHGFDFEAAENAYDDHAKLLMALKALPSERLLRHLAHQRKGRRGEAHRIRTYAA